MTTVKKVKYYLKENDKVVAKELDWDSDSRTYLSTILPSDFLTEDEIAADLVKNLTEEDVKYLGSMKKEDVIMLHHGFGTSIRNMYGLWMEENPYTVLDDAIADNFPDQMSHRIIEKMWDTLYAQGKVSKDFATLENLYEQAMKVLDEKFEDKK